MGVIVVVVFGKIQSAIKIESTKVVQHGHYPRQELTTGGKNLIGISSLKGCVHILSRIQLSTAGIMIVTKSYHLHYVPDTVPNVCINSVHPQWKPSCKEVK